MLTYFFIPATNEKFIKKASDIDADFIVFDFEDSINIDDIHNTSQVLASQINPDRDFARIYWNDAHTELSFDILKEIVEIGFKNFFIPKVRGKKECELILNWIDKKGIPNNDIGLIVENPLTLMELTDIMKSYQIYALALGSHDYCAEMGMKHNLKNISWARNYLLNVAHAYNIQAIYIASMNLHNKESFLQECQDGFDLGFDAKFLIHPQQLKWLNENNFFSDDELELALLVKDYIVKIGGEEHFVITKLKDQIIERPHLKRFKRILNSTSYGSF